MRANIQTLSEECQERPHCERITITLTPELAGYVRDQAHNYPGLCGAPNTSAFMRDLIVRHREELTARQERAQK